MRYSRDLRTRQPSGRRTLTQRALAILAKYGSSANLYLPGVGAINGITAGNWLDSNGTTAATVNNRVGLVVGAGKEVGLNICPDYDSAAWQTLGSSSPNWVRSAGVASVVGDGVSAGVSSKFIRASWVFAANKSYEVSFEVLSSNNVGGFSIQNNTDNNLLGWIKTVGKYKYVHKSGGVNPEMLGVQATGGWTGSIGPLSVRELPGAHLTQATTANKPILGLSGGVYSWQFDGSNDSFTSTMTPGNAGFFCASANVTDSGVLRTLLGAGASSDASSGVWLARSASDALTLQVGNGTTRNNVSAAYPVSTTAIASAGWDSSTMFVGINNTETSGAKSVNCTSSNAMNVGVLTGTTLPMLGTIGATIITTVLPTAAERAVLRRFIASLSGVTL